MQQLVVGNENVALAQGRHGFKGGVENLAGEISKVAQGIPQELARGIAAFVQGAMSNPKGAFTAALAGAAMAQAHGVVLVERFNLDTSARSSRGFIQDVTNLQLGYVLAARPFSVTDSAVFLDELKVRGNFKTAAGNYREPIDDFRKLTFMVYRKGADGKPESALSPLTFTRFNHDQIGVVSTGLSDAQGHRIDDFVMSFSTQTQLTQGDYFGVIVSETARMNGGSGLPFLRVANTFTALGSSNNSYEAWSTINGGAWSLSQDNGNGLTSDMYLSANPVPEPASMIGLGAASLAFVLRRRRKD